MKFLHSIKRHLARLFGEEYTPNPRIPLPRQPDEAEALEILRRDWGIDQNEDGTYKVVGEDDRWLNIQTSDPTFELDKDIDAIELRNSLGVVTYVGYGKFKDWSQEDLAFGHHAAMTEVSEVGPDGWLKPVSGVDINNLKYKGF